MKKKIAVLMLTGMMAVSMTACGSTTGSDSDTTASAETEENTEETAEDSSEDATEETTEDTSEETAEDASDDSSEDSDGDTVEFKYTVDDLDFDTDAEIIDDEDFDLNDCVTLGSLEDRTLKYDDDNGKDDLFEEILADTEFNKIPKKYLEMAYDGYTRSVIHNCEEYDMPLYDYFQAYEMTEDDYIEQITPGVLELAERWMFIDALAENGLTVSDDELTAEKQKLADKYGKDDDSMEETYGYRYEMDSKEEIVKDKLAELVSE